MLAEIVLPLDDTQRLPAAVQAQLDREPDRAIRRHSPTGIILFPVAEVKGLIRLTVRCHVTKSDVAYRPAGCVGYDQVPMRGDPVTNTTVGMVALRLFCARPNTPKSSARLISPRLAGSGSGIN